MTNITRELNSKFCSDKIKAYINIRYAAYWTNCREYEFFKPYGISFQQYNILKILSSEKEPIKVQIIKNKMIGRVPKATRLMDKLYYKKLIDKLRSENDKRIAYIAITGQGLKLLHKIESNLVIGFLNNFSEEEITQLNYLLDKLS
ncbi:MAG: transcriptional regulator, SarA/Rot family [Tenacibaculum sp.]